LVDIPIDYKCMVRQLDIDTPSANSGLWYFSTQIECSNFIVFLKIETEVITNIAARLIGRSMILLIVYKETFIHRLF
jgi:hypothetical protein